MKNKFSCPNCGTKQKFSKIFFLSNSSKWSCPLCRVDIGPVLMSPIAGLMGFLATAIPAYLLIFIKKTPFMKGIGISAISGLILYLFSLFYFYFNIKLEKK